MRALAAGELAYYLWRHHAASLLDPSLSLSRPPKAYQVLKVPRLNLG